MSASRPSRSVSKLILKKLSDSGVPHYAAAQWSGISPAKLSLRLSGGVEWKLSELSEFSAQVLGVPVSDLLREAECTA